MKSSLCSLNSPARAAAGSPWPKPLWCPALWSSSQCPGAQAAPGGTATFSPTTPQTVATGMKRIMAVLWEVQTFQKPCEGQDHLWAVTYVLNLTVALAEKQQPKNHLCVLSGCFWKMISSKREDPCGGVSGALMAPGSHQAFARPVLTGLRHR